MSGDASRFSPEAVARVRAFDPAALVREAKAHAATFSPEDGERHRAAREKSRLDAARYLIVHGFTDANLEAHARRLLRRGNEEERYGAARYLTARRGAA